MLDYTVTDVDDDTESLDVRLMGDGIMALFQVPEGDTNAQGIVLSYSQVKQLVAIFEQH